MNGGMNGSLEFCVNRASALQIAEHLRACDSTFTPPLSERVGIDDYTRKIAVWAVRFEAWAKGDLVGLVAAYCNDREKRIAYITSLSVLSRWQGQGVASQLVANCISHATANGFACIELEVDRRNFAAVSLYEKHGFSIGKTDSQSTIMHLLIL